MKRILIVLISLLMMLLIGRTRLTAQKLTPRPPIYGIPAKTLPRGHWVFRGYTILPQYDKMWNAQQNKMVKIPSGTELNGTIVIPKIRYGITNRLTAIANIPYVHKKFQKGSAIKKSRDSFGDVVGALLYKFYHNPRQRFLVSALLFTKYPTGKSTGLAPDEMPLGTGSFDVGFALLPEKEFGKWDLRWSAFYIRRGKNKQDVNLGDALSFSWSAACNFNKKFIAEGTLLYKRTGDNSTDGNPIADSNAWLLQIIPGIQYRIARTFLTQLAMPITLQSKRPFSDTYEPWIGLYYLF